MTTLVGYCLHMAPAQLVRRVIAEQALGLQAYAKLLHDFLVRSLTNEKQSSTQSVPSVTTVCSLTPSAAELRLEESSCTAGSGLPEDLYPRHSPPNAIHNLDSNTEPVGGPFQHTGHLTTIAEEPYDNQNSAKAPLQLFHSSHCSQRLPHPHGLFDREVEDVGGQFAMKRVMSDTISEYTSHDLMPSPRLTAYRAHYP